MTKVLLVDDDEILRSAIGGVLEQSGFEVAEAHTARFTVAYKITRIPPNTGVLRLRRFFPSPGEPLTNEREY